MIQKGKGNLFPLRIIVWVLVTYLDSLQDMSLFYILGCFTWPVIGLLGVCLLTIIIQSVIIKANSKETCKMNPRTQQLVAMLIFAPIHLAEIHRYILCNEHVNRRSTQFMLYDY